MRSVDLKPGDIISSKDFKGRRVLSRRPGGWDLEDLHGFPGPCTISDDTFDNGNWSVERAPSPAPSTDDLWAVVFLDHPGDLLLPVYDKAGISDYGVYDRVTAQTKADEWSDRRWTNYFVVPARLVFDIKTTIKTTATPKRGTR